MSKEIKTREVKKDIRALDKAGAIADRTKNAFIRTKDEAMQTQRDGQDHSSPSEYAEHKVTDAAQSATHEAGHQVKNQAKKAPQRIREARESVHEFRDTVRPHTKKASDMPKEQMKKKAQDAARRSSSRARQTVDKTVKQSARTSKKTVKSATKGTVKTAQKSVKTAQKTAKTTIKTTKQAAKTAQKTAQATAKAAKVAAQTARAAAKAAASAAKAAVKAIIAFVKMAIAAIKGLIAAIAAGGWIAVVIILIICLIGLIVGSVLGIFYSNETSDITMTEVVTELNQEFADKIEQIQRDNPHDIVNINNYGSGSAAGNWRDVLAVYAARTAAAPEDAMEVASLDESKKAIIREIFWDMNDISFTVTTTQEPDRITDDPVEEEAEEDNDEDETEPKTYTVLTINVAAKNQAEMRTAYNFTDFQNEMLDELLLPEYQSLFMQLTGSYVNISLSPEELAALLENLPQDLGERRQAVVTAAYSLIGKVNYFWGGKSTVIGWDSRWGTPTKVTSGNSPTTGTIRPFGLDCSGYVTWAFCNAAGTSDAVNIIRHGTSNQYANCHKIEWSELLPGDIVFFNFKSPHVGIVIGKKPNGNVIIAHCSSSRNNVVVDEYSGPKSGGFCLPARPYFYD